MAAAVKLVTSPYPLSLLVQVKINRSNDTGLLCSLSPSRRFREATIYSSVDAQQSHYWPKVPHQYAGIWVATPLHSY